MKKSRQLNLNDSISFINKQIKQGYTITRTVFNGIIKGERRVLVEWHEPSYSLNDIVLKPGIDYPKGKLPWEK